MQKKDLKRLIGRHVMDSLVWNPPTQRKSFIRLDLNEGYSALSPKILSDLKKFDSFTVTSYPEYEELNRALAKYCGTRTENICLTSGSDHAIQMLLNLFFHEGDRVVVPAPTFHVYFLVLKLIGARPNIIFYKNKDGNFQFPFKETEKAINQKTRGLLLCNPNNPLGSSIAREQLLILVKKCHRYKIPVIIDEAYAEYGGESAVKLISKYNNVIILRTFSKAFGLAGLRLGYVIAPSSIINELSKLRLAWSVNHFAVHAGIIVLKHLSHFKRELHNHFKRKKEFIAFLRRNNIFCYDTAANFIIAKVNNSMKFIAYLRSKGILVKDLSKYPHSHGFLEKTVRINIPAEKDMDKVKRVISNY